MALKSQNVRLELREVVLRDKPPSLLALSPKATVPVLQTADGKILEESLDIMVWALPVASPWFDHAPVDAQLALARDFDSNFKPLLDAYKYHGAQDMHAQSHYRDQAAAHLDGFEEHLQTAEFLLGEKPQFLDLAVMPFVRQFASVDRQWFDEQPRQRLRLWLDRWLQDPLFVGIMQKFPQWKEGTKGESWPPDLDT